MDETHMYEHTADVYPHWNISNRDIKFILFLKQDYVHGSANQEAAFQRSWVVVNQSNMLHIVFLYWTYIVLFHPLPQL